MDLSTYSTPRFALFCLRRRAKVYDRFQQDFRRIFKKGMKQFWNNLTGFDVIKLDELLQPGDNQSSLAAAAEKFGQEAADLIEQILEAEKETTEM